MASKWVRGSREKGAKEVVPVLPLDKGRRLNALALGRQRGPEANSEGPKEGSFSFDRYPPMASMQPCHHTSQQLLPAFLQEK